MVHLIEHSSSSVAGGKNSMKIEVLAGRWGWGKLPDSREASLI